MTSAGTTPSASTRKATAAQPRMACKVYRARPDQVREARKFLRASLAGCPAADDAILCLSELASNSVLHSNSRKPGGTFTVRVTSHEGNYVHIEVEDNGGSWQEPALRDGRPHGLDIVRQLADDYGTGGGALTGWVAWATLGWDQP